MYSIPDKAVRKMANAIIIKPNQIGTVQETLEAIKVAREYDWKIIVSHRSGETMDTFISDLAVGVGAYGIKAGAHTQPERKAKYDRLIEIEKEFVADLKKRIDETAKYIRPNEGTLPFAMMFIPAEGIYYDLLVNEIGAIKSNTRSLIDYAYKDKNVIIVSPTTFSAYLRSVLYGFRAFKIEESARDIAKRVEELGKHLKAYEEYYNKIGNSLQTTVNHYNSAGRELKKVDKDILKITGTSAGLETISIDKPTSDNEE